ncbi:MAG: dienelactone hydrolase family protein [Alphaproteobacteria bacterium]|nr:dienelactone hydrolase family protein [Alphaproteobacteria bacterium]
MSLNGPSILPQNENNVKQAIIFLHGYGADGNDLIGMHRHFARKIPDTAFYSPHAPFSCEMSPFGKQWFSLDNYDPEKLRNNAQQTGEFFDNMYQGVQKAAPFLDNYISEIMELHKIEADKIILVGFSQGTMMALHVALRREKPIAAVIGFSGTIMGAVNLKNEITARPPVLLTHGDADTVVPVEAMYLAEKTLKEADVNVSSHVASNIDHGIDEQSMMLAIDFIADKLS